MSKHEADVIIVSSGDETVHEIASEESNEAVAVPECVVCSECSVPLPIVPGEDTMACVGVCAGKRRCAGCGHSMHDIDWYCFPAEYKRFLFLMGNLEKEYTDTPQRKTQPRKRKLAKSGIGYDGQNGLDRKASESMSHVLKRTLEKDRRCQWLFNAMVSLLDNQHMTPHRAAVLLESMQTSNLHAILASLLRQVSIIELAKRCLFYESCFHLVCSIAAQRRLRWFLLYKGKENDSENMHDILIRIRNQLLLYERSDSCTTSDERQEMTRIGHHVKKAVDMLNQATSKDQVIDIDELEKPENVLNEVKFGSMDLSHTFSLQSTLPHVLSSAGGRMKRIRREIATLSTNLPDGVFMRVDETRLDMIRFLVLGPEGTPYESGAFLFDMALGARYPSVPPSVLFLTTGKARFRFNPNLYANGKICLSLLGTWQGPGWDPVHSTILQVIVSIQAFIFCAEPYCNEPGWELHPKGPNSQMQRYHRLIEHATLTYALAWHIRSPPIGFEDVIDAHLRLNKDTILSWIDQCTERRKATKGKFTGYQYLCIAETWAKVTREITKHLKQL